MTAQQLADLSVDDVTRFFDRVDHRGVDECWPWKAGRSSGYGQMNVRGRDVGAHRLAYAIANDVDPGSLFVCHRCDSPACCNPAHLFLGTSAENTADKVAKGRAARGNTHYLAKLTGADAVAIREAYAAGGVSHRALATRYGVSKPCVKDVVARRTWKHVA